MGIDTDLEHIMDADNLQEAKKRFQECLAASEEPLNLRKIVWPLLFGIEGNALRQALYGIAPTDYG